MLSGEIIIEVTFVQIVLVDLLIVDHVLDVLSSHTFVSQLNIAGFSNPAFSSDQRCVRLCRQAFVGKTDSTSHPVAVDLRTHAQSQLVRMETCVIRPVHKGDSFKILGVIFHAVSSGLELTLIAFVMRELEINLFEETVERVESPEVREVSAAHPRARLIVCSLI